MSTITVRQTTDPYVDDIQYIAWREVPLELNGGLRMSTIGLGQPGDEFFIAWNKQHPNSQKSSICLYIPSSGIVDAFDLQIMTTLEDGPYPILTIVERGDDKTAYERYVRRRDTREREQQLAYLKGLVTGGWNWVSSVLPPIMPVMTMASQHLDTHPITPKGRQPEIPDSFSTSVPDVPNSSGLVRRANGANRASGGGFGLKV